MNKYTEAIQGDDVVILCDGIPMGVGEILAALNAATPLPADAALADELLRLSKAFDTSPNNAASVSMNRRAADSLRDTLIQAAARLRALSAEDPK